MNDRPIHILQEDSLVAKSIEDASMIWPDEKSRTELLLKVLAEGAKVIRRRVEQQEAIQKLVEAGTGLWPLDWDTKRKDEWPD